MKDITRCKDGLLALDTKLKKKTEESQSHLKTISELKVQLVEMDKGTSVNSSISTSSRVGGDKPGSIPNDQEVPEILLCLSWLLLISFIRLTE